MPKFDKPDSPNIIWGVNALEEDLTRPNDSYIQTGWTQVKPPYEYENYSMNKLYQGFAYYNQLGFPEWDSVTEYQAGKSYVQASNNIIYKCIQTHSNRNPSTVGNENYWEIFEGNRSATTTARGTLKISTDAEAIGGVGSSAITPANLLNSIFPSPTLSPSGEISIPINDGGDVSYLTVKWGTLTVSGDATTSGYNLYPVTFSTPFPNACLKVLGTFNNLNVPASESKFRFALEQESKNGFQVAIGSGLSYTGQRISWVAIGY